MGIEGPAMRTASLPVATSDDANLRCLRGKIQSHQYAGCAVRAWTGPLWTGWLKHQRASIIIHVVRMDLDDEIGTALVPGVNKNGIEKLHQQLLGSHVIRV